MNMPRSAEAKQQMIKECKKYYWDRPRQMLEVTEFQRVYTQETAISWYTKPCFIHRLVNEALRTENIASLWIFRYFIGDLCTSLRNARMKITEPLVLYRGTKIAHSEIVQLRVGSLISTNGFFSTSRHRDIAELFITRMESMNDHDHDHYVMFEIVIQPHSFDVIIADVANQSAIPDEAEVLFDLGTVFEILSYEKEDKHPVWHIRIRPSSEIQDVRQDFERFILTQMEYTSPLILFGMLFSDMSEYKKSLTYFRDLLRTQNLGRNDLANVYCGLARTYRFMGRHKAALALMRQAERLQRQMLPRNNFDYARTLASLATVYAVMDEYQHELFYYKKAYALYRNILPTQKHIEIARSLSRLGLAFLHQHQYTRALSVLSRSLKVHEQTMPEKNPYKADAVELVGIAHDYLGNVEITFSYIEKAVAMRHTCLNQDHERMEHSYFILSHLYEKHCKYQLALKYAYQLLELRERTLSVNHPSLQETRDLVEKLCILTNGQ
ncbi:unnamed protein product [Rotaria socialis]|uniref:NAD(P)(+)--arginine ADP-ribosyltransferase n=2 Tax=Rotaria socialis TaxID=392032 RepID=A0A820V081_9BILA|nr:unnamed protein product [Rotaria socialis]